MDFMIRGGSSALCALGACSLEPRFIADGCQWLVRVIAFIYRRSFICIPLPLRKLFLS
jgi:hypothetical protein